MSRPRHRWYGFVRASIEHMRESSPEDSIQDAIFFHAFNDAVSETLKLPNGDMRVEVVENVLVKRISTIEGEAMRIHYSDATIKGWVNSFVNLCGIKAGYSKKRDRH